MMLSPSYSITCTPERSPCEEHFLVEVVNPIDFCEKESCSAHHLLTFDLYYLRKLQFSKVSLLVL